MRNNSNFGIVDARSCIDTDNGAITFFLKDSQYPTSISTIYISPASTMDLKAKHTDFNCSKADKWGIALKKAPNNADIFLVENSIPTNTDNRTNTDDIIDYIISLPAIYNNIQNLSISNDLPSGHSFQPVN